MGRRCPGDGESILLQFALSSEELLSAHSMTFLDNRSPLTSSSRNRQRDLRSSDSCSLEPPSTARLFPGTAYSRLALLQRGSESTPKDSAARHPVFPARITSPQTNARHDPKKWAGAKMTLRTAWVKRPILPGFCLNDPPAVESIRQVILLEDTAVVRGVWSRSLFGGTLVIGLILRSL